MNEQELCDGLRDVMVASSPPPSMNPNSALDAARRAHRRRRATWAGIGAGATVIAVATTVVLALSPGEGQSLQVAAPPPSASQDTKTSWPNGQTDRTARNGPRAERGNVVHDALVAALPDTLALDTRATAQQSGGSDPLPLAHTQAAFDGKHGNVEVWRYTVDVAVVRKAAPNAGTGKVYVEVLTPGNDADTDLCQAATEWWTNKGACTLNTVQGKQIGVVRDSPDDRISQVVAYRYPDGTLVVAAQNTKVSHTTLPGLGDNPMTIEQLSALALNPAFKLD
ncbi:hypothetical protein [Actinocrispum wychmicini]|uniref:Uncharacterized protein n=1 Tax=Actinocrispum wychmicini TaxID=1213861 RepID=A0A4R2JGK5_9PSEU|nr:hypothetical protein [Actinocrispum wychmicini]TCO56028.1 hypothetical protein EV192_107453 [Actinocrispum wychmicini]